MVPDVVMILGLTIGYVGPDVEFSEDVSTTWASEPLIMNQPIGELPVRLSPLVCHDPIVFPPLATKRGHASSTKGIGESIHLLEPVMVKQN